jgi:hypothetical protein
MFLPWQSPISFNVHRVCTGQNCTSARLYCTCTAGRVKHTWCPIRHPASFPEVQGSGFKVRCSKFRFSILKNPPREGRLPRRPSYAWSSSPWSGGPSQSTGLRLLTATLRVKFRHPLQIPEQNCNSKNKPPISLNCCKGFTCKMFKNSRQYWSLTGLRLKHPMYPPSPGKDAFHHVPPRP